MDAVLVVTSPSCSFSSSSSALSSTQVSSTAASATTAAIAGSTATGTAGLSKSLRLSRSKNAGAAAPVSKRMLSSTSSNSAGYSLVANNSCHGIVQRQLSFQPKQGSSRASFEITAAADGAVALEAAAEATQGTDETVPIEKRYPAFPSVLDINAIRNILPHRFPFLLVDRVIEYNQGVSAVAIKNVTINDNFFPGHFPERPIMPGVLMVEAMAQVGGIVMLNPEVGGSKESFFFAGVDKVRFRKPVIAGDTLVMRMTLVKLQKRFGIAKMEGKAYVGSDVVCEGEFLMALGSSDQ